MKKLKIPPFYLLISVLSIVLLSKYFPVIEFDREKFKMLSLLILLTGISLLSISSSLFTKHKTPIKPFKESTHLITTGIYKYSRNPIYLGMVLILIGVGIYMGAGSSLFVVLIFIYFIRKDFVIKEEAFLLELFGEEYKNYKEKVRRWF